MQTPDDFQSFDDDGNAIDSPETHNLTPFDLATDSEIQQQQSTLDLIFANLDSAKFSRRYWQKRVDGADKAAERVGRISQNRIDAFIAASHFQALIDTTDPEFQPYETITCNKTGQVIGQQTAQTISAVIHTHSFNRKRVHEVLQLTALQQRAPAWIHTDPQALKNLSCDDPIGFFVYFSTQISCKDTQFKLQDLPLDRQWSLHMHKRELHEWMTGAIDNNTLRELHAVNQLLARVLSIRTFNTANRKPTLMRCFKIVDEHANNGHRNLALYLGAWIVALRDALRYLVAARAASNAKAARENLHQRAPTAADIANIRLDFGGNKALQMMGQRSQQHADEHMAAMLSAALDLRQRKTGESREAELTRELRAVANKTAAKKVNLLPRGGIQHSGMPNLSPKANTPAQETQSKQSLRDTFKQAFGVKPDSQSSNGFSFSFNSSNPSKSK